MSLQLTEEQQSLVTTVREFEASAKSYFGVCPPKIAGP